MSSFHLVVSFLLAILLVLCSFFDRALINTKTYQDITDKIPDLDQRRAIADLSSGASSLTVHIANTIVFVANLVIGTELYNHPHRNNAIIAAMVMSILSVYSLTHVCVRLLLSDIEDKEVLATFTAGDIMRFTQVGYVIITAAYWSIGYYLGDTANAQHTA